MGRKETYDRGFGAEGRVSGNDISGVHDCSIPSHRTSRRTCREGQSCESVLHLVEINDSDKYPKECG